MLLTTRWRTIRQARFSAVNPSGLPALRTNRFSRMATGMINKGKAPGSAMASLAAPAQSRDLMAVTRWLKASARSSERRRAAHACISGPSVASNEGRASRSARSISSTSPAAMRTDTELACLR